MLAELLGRVHMAEGKGDSTPGHPEGLVPGDSAGGAGTCPLGDDVHKHTEFHKCQ